MKDDQQEAFEKTLSAILGRIIDFLKYAEAKNAALLTFSSAWIIGSINLLNNPVISLGAWQGAFQLALPLFCVAAVCAIASFMPRLGLPRIHRDPEQAKSLLYFGDIATFAPAAYRERVRERYYPSSGETATRNLLDDLSIQIAVNSQVTVRKMLLFKCGVLAVLLALLVLAKPTLQIAWAFKNAYFGA